MIIPLDLCSLLKELPQRATNTHKGNFGHVLVIGGDFGYAGAPVLAALGALRSGAGLVTVASHSQNLIGLNACHPEIMTCAIDKPRSIEPMLKRATVVVLGPGLGRSSWSKKIFKRIIKISLPLLVDADALFFLGQQPQQYSNRILTPHPGEAASLLHLKQPIDQSNRTTAINDLIKKYAATIVLKGAGTLVGSKEHTIGICNAGNPGMATAGMGDLLSGVIAGLVAQGMSLGNAAKLGVCIHATAGDITSKSGATRMIATDLLPHIPKIISGIYS